MGATLLDRKPLCGGIRTEAWVGTFGTMPGIRPEQVEHSKLIVAWGNNVTWSNLHLMPIINRARRAGAKLVVVDPRRIKIAEQADLHLALRPGTDVVLAWAVAAELERRGAIDRAFIDALGEGFEEFMALARPWTIERAAETCGLAEADVARFAEWYATITPASISVGNGLERNRNGGSGIRAVLALPALAGQVRRPPAAASSTAPAFAFPKTPQKLARPDLVPPGTRTLNIVDVGRHLTEATLSPPLKALFIYNHNPVVVHPDQNRHAARARARGRVHGRHRGRDDRQHAYCDIVLPACTHFEHHDLFAAYGQHWLQRAEPVIPPQGESLPNTEIFRRLAARFGYTEPCFTATDAELMDDAVDPRRPAAGRRAAEPHPARPRHAHDGERRRRDDVHQRLPEDAVGQGRAGLVVPREEVRRPAAVVPAAGVDLSADADLAGLRPAHHLDVRRHQHRATTSRRWRCIPTTRGRAACATASRCGCGTSSARCACRCGSPTTCRAASSRRSRARGSDQRQRPDGLGPGPRHPRRHLRGRLLQRRAGGGGAAATS